MSASAVIPDPDAEGIAEGALLERAVAGDRAAQEQLVCRYLEDVFRVTYRVLGSREQAEDATQDTFVNALQALPRFRGRSSFRTWLLRIALNAARSQGRRATRRRETALDAVDEIAGGERDAALATEQRSEAVRIEQALSRLPTKQRLAVTLRIQQGLSYREIAAATDSSEGAVRVNYHLGIRKLRELLQ